MVKFRGKAIENALICCMLSFCRTNIRVRRVKEQKEEYLKYDDFRGNRIDTLNLLKAEGIAIAYNDRHQNG